MDYTQFEGHTPGPWKVEPTQDGRNNIFGGGLHVACLPSADKYGYPDAANARLIAAAPALLADNAQLRAEVERLKAALKDVADGSSDPYSVKLARAALGKGTA